MNMFTYLGMSINDKRKAVRDERVPGLPGLPRLMRRQRTRHKDYITLNDFIKIPLLHTTRTCRHSCLPKFPLYMGLYTPLN